MNRSRALLVLSLFIGVAALAGTLLCEDTILAKLQRVTQDCTDEQIITLPYFDLIATANENRNLPCDVISYSLGDGYIHLILPDDVPENGVAVYIRDIQGNLLARRVFDFSQKVMIGSWEVVLDRPTLPVVYFESQDPDAFDAMNASETKNIICNGNMHMCVGKEEAKQNGWFREYLSHSDDCSSKTTASLQGRGYSSWRSVSRKKSYTLRLSKAENLLGMGEHKSWNLVGNSFDVSLIRNIVFNNMAKKIGIAYQPEMRDVNLFVDGKYEGVYTLTTKIKVSKNEIPLRKGDYLYKIDPPVPEQPILYDSKTWEKDVISYPVADLVFPEEATGDELLESQAILQTFINTVEDPSETDITKICDMDSIARYYWIEEIAMNFDAWGHSLYMYYSRKDDKMYLGPLWDMDFTLGAYRTKMDVSFLNPDGWKIRNAGWFETLFTNSEFRKKVKDVYFDGGVRDAMLLGVDDFINEREHLGNDAYVNYSLFGYVKERNIMLDFGGTYDEYTDAMIQFYRQRIEWIDSAMNP